MPFGELTRNGTHPALSKQADYPIRADLLPRLEFHLGQLYHTALHNGKRGIFSLSSL